MAYASPIHNQSPPGDQSTVKQETKKKISEEKGAQMK
jgi:hypothetical protein